MLLGATAAIVVGGAIGQARHDASQNEVTADCELSERVRAANGKVVGPSWLLDQLVD